MGDKAMQSFLVCVVVVIICVPIVIVLIRFAHCFGSSALNVPKFLTILKHSK